MSHLLALAGNQNCGKTTLFNALTGSNQHVGNFPGVTVDRKDGVIRGHDNTLVTDLPGIYSMSPYTSEEIVTRQFLLDDKPKGIINIRIKDVGDFIQVEIEDNGKGIAAKDLPYIFDRFYRTDVSRNSSKGGSGIGLSIVKKIIDGAHAAGVKVIASNHDFFKTPAKADIIYRLRKMQDMNADIPKIAVMPQNKKDVLTLLAATEEMTTNYADRPIITMSMAGTGVISRLCGEVFGSSMTFGAAKKASAPGQMGVNDLSTVLDLLHKAM